MLFVVVWNILRPSRKMCYLRLQYFLRENVKISADKKAFITLLSMVTYVLFIKSNMLNLTFAGFVICVGAKYFSYLLQNMRYLLLQNVHKITCLGIAHSIIKRRIYFAKNISGIFNMVYYKVCQHCQSFGSELTGLISIFIVHYSVVWWFLLHAL